MSGDSLTFGETVMHKLGNIEGKLDNLAEEIKERHAQLDNRLKPLEATHKKMSWVIGLAVGIGSIITLFVEKIGLKWLNLIS